MIELLQALPFWQMEVLGNTVLTYTVAVIVFFVLFIVFQIVLAAIIKRAQHLFAKTKNGVDDLLFAILRSASPKFYLFLSFWFSLKYLHIHPVLTQALDAILTIWLISITVSISGIIIEYLVKSQNGIEENASMVGILRQLVMGSIWVLGILLLLSNNGVNITSLIAGLGIGGVAVALAAQNILEDLFSSFTIYFDKPFQVGDLIQVGGDSGTVKKIGIKTTRLRSLQGEEIVISNKELTSTRINNFRRIKKRDVVFRIGVTYDTPQEKLRAIPSFFESTLENLDLVVYNRAHLREFADSAIIFELSYSIASDEFQDYLDRQQEILLRLNEVFAKEKIEFAYPTQTIHLQK